MHRAHLPPSYWVSAFDERARPSLGDSLGGGDVPFTLLLVSRRLCALQPLNFGEFCKTVAHTRNSSPGPDGVPYSVLCAAGESGCRILYRAYRDLLSGVLPPAEFNRSLIVYIPKELDHSTPGIPSAHASKVRAITLSNTSHELFVEGCQCHARQGCRDRRPTRPAGLHARAQHDHECARGPRAHAHFYIAGGHVPCDRFV